jgi:DNA polymerase/3'-5' exonuclease PolX
MKPCGGVRRGREASGDIDLLVTDSSERNNPFEILKIIVSFLRENNRIADVANHDKPEILYG